jgi:WD40 repeat protein
MDRTARGWDLATGEQVLALRHPAIVFAAEYSPGGDRIVTATEDGIVRLWEGKTQELLHELRGHVGQVEVLRFNPSGRFLATGSYDEHIRIWDLKAGGRPLLRLWGHEQRITCLRFTSETRLVSGSGDGTVRSWDIFSTDAFTLLNFPDQTARVRAVAIRGEGTLVAGGYDDGTVRLYDPATGDYLGEIGRHSTPVSAVSFNRSGTALLSAAMSAKVWDAKGRELVAELESEGISDFILAAAFAPDDRSIALGTYGKAVKVWRWKEAGAAPAVLAGHEGAVTSVAFSEAAGGRYLATGSMDGTARIWDWRAGKEVARLEGHTAAVTCVAFGPRAAGRLLSGSSDTSLRVSSWRGKEAQDTDAQDAGLVLRGHDSGVKSAVFSPDGSRIISGSSDGALIVWDAATGDRLLSLDDSDGEINGLAVTRDGKSVVSAGVRTIRVRHSWLRRDR